MEIRFPRINFDGVPAIWGADLEYVCLTNANSTTLPALEPFMISVFNKAKQQLDPVADAELIREVELFCGQEAQHYRQHIKFNKIFEDGRYPKLEALEQEFAGDMKRFTTERSLAFCLGYSEGFESTGSVFFRAWFEILPQFRIGARDEVVRMWDWHNAEEFEHREVAFKLYMATCARGGLWKRMKYGYFYRLYCAVYALKHMFNYTMRVQQHMLEIERAKMTAAEVSASKRHFKAMHKIIRKATTSGMLKLFSPFYNPARIDPPRGMNLILERFVPGGQYGPAKRGPAAQENT